MPPILSEISDLDGLLHQGACLGIGHDTLLVGWGNISQNAIPSHGKPSFYSNDFLLTRPRPWFNYEYNALISTKNLRDQIGEPDYLFRTWSKPDWSKFKIMFHQVQAAIDQGELVKAVPIIRSGSDKGINRLELRSMLGHALRLPRGLTPYGMWKSEEGILGASPELLFAATGRDVSSIALAGTERHNEEGHDPLTDPKEQAEHQIVVDFLSKQFTMAGQAEVGETKMMCFGNISHLMTPISGKVAKLCSFSDLVTLLHPTPALGVAPQVNWRTWAPMFGHRKGNLFAAPFGVSLPGQILRCIAGIRGVQWTPKKINCTAGCGIVRNSQIAHEQGEILHKMNTIKQNLGIKQ